MSRDGREGGEVEIDLRLIIVAVVSFASVARPSFQIKTRRVG